MKVIFYAGALFCSVDLFAPPSDFSGHYDEIFDPEGNVRPGYAEIYAVFERLDERQKAQFRRQSIKELQGDNAILPIPRAFTTSEYEKIQRGVQQRGRALLMFLQDHYSGKKSYEGKVIPPGIIDQIILRHNEKEFEGKVDPSRLQLFYGPDLIRGPDGKWRVVEDNTGFLGGFGDLLKMREVLETQIPEYRKILAETSSPQSSLEALAQFYKAQANGEKVIVYQVPPYADHEDNRFRQIMISLGIEVITPDTVRKLRVADDGVYVTEKLASGETKSEKVGFIIVNADFVWVDTHHPIIAKQWLLEEAEGHLAEARLPKKAREEITEAMKPDPTTGEIDLKELDRALNRSKYLNSAAQYRYRKSSKGLLDAILDGRVKVNNSPGTDFINDKDFYRYVDDLVRFYLQEEPILENIETRSFAKHAPDGQVTLDNALMKEVSATHRKFVIKGVDGRGGDAVWVGAKIPTAEFKDALEKVKENPAKFIVQSYTPLSRTNEYIVDTRPYSAIAPHGSYVFSIPWGRANLIMGTGKVNVSGDGAEMNVVIIPNCFKVYKGSSAFVETAP